MILTRTFSHCLSQILLRHLVPQEVLDFTPDLSPLFCVWHARFGEVVRHCLRRLRYLSANKPWLIRFFCNQDFRSFANSLTCTSASSSTSSLVDWFGCPGCLSKSTLVSVVSIVFSAAVSFSTELPTRKEIEFSFSNAINLVLSSSLNLRLKVDILDSLNVSLGCRQ